MFLIINVSFMLLIFLKSHFPPVYFTGGLPKGKVFSGK